MHQQPNVRTTLKRRSRAEHPMTAYDRLPPELRGWLAQAALPWSAQSALRLWQRSLQVCNGNTELAHSELTRIERKQLCQDAHRIWGREHPAASEVAGLR